jgi:toxin ParE1/3/4
VKSKPVVARRVAEKDILLAMEYSAKEGGPAAVLALIDALESSLRHISAHPASGSPRYAVELNLPGLRSWPIKRSAYLVFYIEREDHIDVWRVLHARRDLPASLWPGDN